MVESGPKPSNILLPIIYCNTTILSSIGWTGIFVNISHDSVIGSSHFGVKRTKEEGVPTFFETMRGLAESLGRRRFARRPSLLTLCVH